ncbi:hypothetical protein AAMO2058_000696800 [Amorphochlora amoebiformis]
MASRGGVGSLPSRENKALEKLAGVCGVPMDAEIIHIMTEMLKLKVSPDVIIQQLRLMTTKSVSGFSPKLRHRYHKSQSPLTDRKRRALYNSGGSHDIMTKTRVSSGSPNSQPSASGNVFRSKGVRKSGSRSPRSRSRQKKSTGFSGSRY